jgi:hypothetical protein
MIIDKENSQTFDFHGFKVDNKHEIMMLLTKELEHSLSDKLFMKVLHLNNTDSIILECEISEPQMKGILLSGDFSLIDGHIYYNNNIIKVRYDLMKLYGNCHNTLMS